MRNDSSIRKWTIWFVLVMAFITVFFHRLAISVVADDLILDLGLTGKGLGNLTSMTFYGYALMQIPVGIMVDSIGVRKICTWGTLLTGIGSILFGLSSTLIISYLARFIVGLGTSVIIISILKIQMTWFKPSQFSTLCGLTSLFGNMGAFLATLPLAFLVLQVGWRNSFYVMGLISIVLSFLIWLIVRDYPEGMEPEYKKRNIGKGIKTVLLNPYTWPPFSIMFLMVGSMTAILGLWGIPYLMHVYEITKSQAAGYLSFVSIGFMVGGPIVGWLSDRLNGEIKRILAVAISLFTLIWIYMAFVGGKPPIEILPIIFFALGATTICHILSFTNVKDVNDPAFTGSATAIINVGEFIGGSFLSFAIGLFLDFGWRGRVVDGGRIYEANQYQFVFAFIGLLSLVSLGSLMFMKGKETKRKGLNAENNIAI
ncbi:MFS transporter [Alkaliphilus peptidifermentans]|uniref:Sugar phosphate permease n=1 Tax=Alkaliphilus peptidifermentans DSM 18978 TaxID=1120976 RepID=A0A1G5EK27_9FIRM|nr:MFS transporter [Alkaliphilus peptidifermentans]SCY27363.1 Sugar phosphate permease [Alkaliphilus peptidifermentans DSM 18978]